jgi:hypothetical protein
VTKRKPVEPAPGPLEDYAARFDDLLAHRAQRQGLRRYVEGLLMPEESATRRLRPWPKHREPVAGAQRLPKLRACSGSSRSPAGTLRR